MAFRLPANLVVKQQYSLVTPGSVTVLEESLPASSRMLVGLVFSERYSGFEEDCSRANAALLQEPGLFMWKDYLRFVTPDEDGEPIAWVTYQSSPVWWTIILLILGGAFTLPIIAALPVWITDLFFPGFIEMIGTIGTLVVIGGVIFLLPKILKPSEEKK